MTMRSLRTAIKLAVCACLYYSGVTGLFARWWPRRRPVILCAHRVTSENDPFFRGIPRQRFAAEVAYLARHHRVLPLDEIADALRHGRPLPRGTVGITFDDGAVDNFDVAHPILQRHGLPATIFLVADSVQSRRLPWPERVVYLLQHTSQPRLELRTPEHRILPLGTQRERLAAIETILALLKACRTDTRREAVEALEAALAVGPDRDRMLSWAQCRRMAGAGIAFGAHTLTHPILPRTEPVDMKREIVDSKIAIEARLGQRVRYFAYPNDDVCPAAIDAVEAAGFDAAFAGADHVNDAPVNPFAIGRIPWDLGPVSVFAADVSGILEPLRWLVSRGFRR